MGPGKREPICFVPHLESFIHFAANVSFFFFFWGGVGGGGGPFLGDKVSENI